ncbi:MAG: outer membrane protein assembly factor BamA [Candidatus Omnitrophica bacterium]|nr:outer membrane protein assembly factor BamA [Candidatus Omnitrophota bacterium]
MKIKNFVIFNFIFLAVLSVIAIMPSGVYAQNAPQESRETITDIAIEGNKAVSTNTILSKIMSRTGARFVQRTVNEDIKRLYATGFFTDVIAEAEDSEGGIKLIFKVTEKSVIGNIVFEGNKVYRADVLRKQIETKEGDVLNKRIIAEDIRKLETFYRKKGYPLVKIEYKFDTDQESNVSTVYITIDEKNQYRIRSIVFTGNKVFTSDRLMKVISTRTDGLFRSGVLDENLLKQDMERLAAFYKDNGFIDAAASYSVEYAEKGITVNISVTENSQYFVGKVNVEGNKVIGNKAIEKDLKMKEKAPYSPSNLRADIISMQTLYFDKGYMECVIKPETLLDKETKTINVSYTISEGSLSYVNEIKITGNSKTKDKVIRRELRLYPGEKFDGDKLKRSKQRLYDLGYFDEVIFDTVPMGEPDKKDLVVSVKESKTGEFSFGGGYSSVDRLIGFVEVAQRNFDITNFKTFTGAGQILSVKAELGYVRQNYTLSFTEPWIFGYPYLFGFDLFSFDRDKKESLGYGYSEKRTGGNLRFGKEFTDYDRADLRYRLERIKIGDVSDDALQALKDEEGKNTISSLALTLTRDTTDSKFNPMQGHVLSATAENAGGPMGGDKDFYKLTGIADFFFNYQKKLVLELKATGGWAKEYDDSTYVPIYERFFAGGANTIRGYKERSVGPRDTNTGDPIGGEAMLVGNAELTYPIFKNFKIAAFYDVGSVWHSTDDDIRADDFKSGTGFGVRVKTPIGPVKVDLGYPLDKAHPDDKQKVRFHFSMTRGF